MPCQQLLSGVRTPVPTAGSQRLPLGERVHAFDGVGCQSLLKGKLQPVAYEAGVGRPPGWKIKGKLFSRQGEVAQKSWKIKNISLQWRIFGQILFFRASAGCSKFWMIKNMYSMQWIQGTLCSSAQAQVAQKSWMQKLYSMQWKCSGKALFLEQAQVYQK